MSDPESVAGRQLSAYNARDIDAFMACWHDDAEIFEHPSTLLARGAEAIRARHLARFEEPDLFGRLVSRTSVADVVVDREVVTRNFPDGRGTIDVLAIYEVRGGKIARAWFKSGPRHIDAATDWDARVQRLWARFSAGGIAEEDLIPAVDALAAERAPGEPAATFERAGARDCVGLEAEAEPLYRSALANGLDAVRRPQAVIQLASTLRNLGRLDESEALLRAELARIEAQRSRFLEDETRAFLSLTLASQGKGVEAAAQALTALAPHLTRYNRSAAAYARELLDMTAINGGV